MAHRSAEVGVGGTGRKADRADEEHRPGALPVGPFRAGECRKFRVCEPYKEGP